MTSFNIKIEFPRIFPELETERLILRQPELDDAADFFEMMGNPNVTQFYDWDTYEDIDEAVGLINILNERYVEQSALRWALVFKENNETIGFGGFFQIQVSFKAGIGFGIKEKY